MYMTAEDKADLIEAVTQTITVVVNGKIDRLKESVESEFLLVRRHMIEQDEAMAPAIEAMQTLQSGRKFILWGAAPIAAIGSLIALFKL